MPLGNYANGTGNISTFTANTNVIGYGTTFLTQLQLGSVISNVSNVFVGYVSNINSNTSITLAANANVAINTNSSPTNFHYRALIANTPAYTYYTTGNISANTYSQIVTGINTHFISELNYGDTLYISNLQIANASGPNVAVGVVELITSNTSLYLSSNAFANVSNLQYWNIPVSYTSTTVYGGYGSSSSSPNTIAGLYTINSQLFRWAQSGLIPNVAVVNNYHPPIRDSVTGILVNLPASIFQKNGNSYANNYTIGSSLTYSGTDYIVKDFDVHQSVFGTDASYVKYSLYNGDILQTAALSDNTQFYNSTISQALPSTSADRAAKLIGANIARVTDNHEIAKQYYSQTSPLDTIKTYPQNLSSNQNLELRKQAKGLRKLVATGAPIAIPGTLNAVADVYIPGNVSWTPPTFNQTPVNLPNINVSFT